MARLWCLWWTFVVASVFVSAFLARVRWLPPADREDIRDRDEHTDAT
jgi:hypothetical protein